MPRLLSGSTLRRGGSGEFLDLKGAMPQLPATDTTATGFTLVTDNLLRTTYRSSLGFVEFKTATMYSSLPEGTIRILATGTTFYSNNTASGTLVVTGGIGVGANMHIRDDIVVNGLTIGQGYQGLNNIVIRGTASPQLDEFNNGQESIAIGYNTLQGLDTSYKNIAIGRFALSSGTDFANNIAIGDSALKNIGSTSTIFIANIVTATTTNPVVLTVNNHNINSGTYIRIFDIDGMVELNNNNFYVKVLTANTLELYSDVILSSPVDGTAYTPYISGGNINFIVIKDNNIAIGNNSGQLLINGEKNFLLGAGVAKYLTTGTGNILIGHDIAENIITGNHNISIGGDNLVDGLDNQVNIGSVIYYNGAGDLQLNSDTEVGVGTTATITTPGQVVSTSTFTAALTVIGGIGVTDNAIIGGTVEIYDETESTNLSTGALVLGGGLAVDKSVNIGRALTVTGTGTITLSPTNAQVSIQPIGTVGYIDNIRIGTATARDAQFTTVNILSATASTSTTTGALTVAGGVGVLGSIYSADGIQEENYLIRIPKITVGTTPPVDPKTGDIWIETSIPAYLLRIKDGANYVWVQLLTV